MEGFRRFFIGVRGFLAEQRDAPRLSRDDRDLAAFEPVRSEDVRRHGGFRRRQRQQQFADNSAISLPSSK